MMKKLFLALASTLILSLAAGLGACSETGTPGGGSAGGKFENLTTTQSVYGFSAASAGMLISSMNDGAQASSAVRSASSDFGGTSDSGQSGPGQSDSQAAPEGGLSDEVKAELDEYMALVGSLLSDGGFETVSEASDRDGYTEKMTVSWRDMQGNASSYVMYYNQTSVPDYDERDDDDDDDWDDRLDDEREENYSIEGVMVVDGTDYAIRGRRNVESDGGESESETSFRVTLGETRYMLVEQESETERGESEQSYSYSVYEDGMVVERSTFSYEEEEGETELEMLAYKNGQTQRFSFDRERVRGEEVIRLSVGSGRDRQRYYVRTATDADGNVTYTYEPISSGR